MGVDCVVWLVPKDRSFRPSADRIAALANGLREKRWAPMPDAAEQISTVREIARIVFTTQNISRRTPEIVNPFEPTPFSAPWIEFHSRHELILEWNVRDAGTAGVQFPFVFVPYPESGFQYFCLRVVLGPDYFYQTGENLMPFDESAIHCECSSKLSYGTGWSSGLSSERIHEKCISCGKRFDPSAFSCEILDGWRGKPSTLAGGLAFRFALVVDCHKNWPHEEERARQYHLKPEFLDLWHRHIGVPFDIVTTYD